MEDFDKFLSYLYSLNRGDIKPGLGRITELLKEIGDPHFNFKSIHVAGTNGKGSVCSLLASILKENGLSVGLYTSPHIFKFNERIKINNNSISDESIVSIYKKLEAKAREISATFFEITTAIAFKYFEINKVDIAIIETGLGGRYDATNIITPLVSVITTISLDHCEYLGSSIKEIANEKAGIIKPYVPVILMEQHPIATSVFLERANKLNSEVYFSFNYSYAKIVGYTSELKMAIQIDNDYCTVTTNVVSPLCGRRQLDNLQAVLRTIEILILQNNIKISSPDIISRGVESVIENTGLKFRLECARANPMLVLDVAHNPGSIHELVSTLHEASQNKLWNIVFGAMEDKDIGQMLEILAPICNTLVIIRPDTERSALESIIEKTAHKVGIKNTHVASSAEGAVEYMNLHPFPTIVTGSFYTVSEVASCMNLNITSTTNTGANQELTENIFLPMSVR